MARKKQPNNAERMLGKKIERLRLVKQMSRMQLGRKINETEQQIAKYETGEFVPLTVLEAIASALGEPIQKKYIRRISFLRKLEIETQVEQEELAGLYSEILPEDGDI